MFSCAEPYTYGLYLSWLTPELKMAWEGSSYFLVEFFVYCGLFTNFAENMEQRELDILYMQRCILLARNGRLTAPPNPMVGAVIVSDDGRIIGEGYHVRAGEGHAEVNAFASVRPEDEPLLPTSTMYVSLEPCSHYGKTPPCADLIVSKGVKRVVVGTVDPFAKVQGRGIQKLLDAGIEVEVGVCEKECQELNKVFFTFHSKQRPFITLKWAQTVDGSIGIKPSEDGESRLIISNELTQMLCHKRRAEHQAILVGNNTWKLDKPSLTVRHWTGRDPRRVVLTGSDSVSAVLERLFNDGVQSLLVEGGRQTLQSFIDEGMWDEAFVEIADAEVPKYAEVVKAPIISQYAEMRTAEFGGHDFIEYRNM